MDKTEEPQVGADIQEIEFYEMWHFLKKKVKSGGSWHKANYCLCYRGGRDAATFKRLHEKVKHLKHCRFSTDDWEAFAKVLPQECHIVGKSGTTCIEQNNSNTRHHLGRMTRRAKVVSQKEKMVHGSMKLWCALTTPHVFSQYQEVLISIFR